VGALIDDKTVALFFEIITNPQLFVADIKALSEIAHKKGVPLIADTTIVPFPAFHAIDFGVDIEVVSSTKYISGGGTGLGGLLIDYGRFDWSQSPSPALQSRDESRCADDATGGVYGDAGSRHTRHPFPASGLDRTMACQTVSGAT